MKEVHSAEVEAKARELYEQSRKRVAGRPRWDRLNPDDEYDMGMKAHAYIMAEEAVAKAPRSKS